MSADLQTWERGQGDTHDHWRWYAMLETILKDRTLQDLLPSEIKILRDHYDELDTPADLLGVVPICRLDRAYMAEQVKLAICVQENFAPKEVLTSMQEVIMTMGGVPMHCLPLMQTMGLNI